MLRIIQHTVLIGILFLGLSGTASAQETNSVLSGYFYGGFEWDEDANSFVTGNFAPVFLWSHGDRLLFESELKLGYGHGGFSVDMEYANLSYILNDYLTLRAGKFLSPFNAYNERLHPAWINKMPNDPLGLGHHDPVGPPYEFGAELRGGAGLGSTRVNYALLVSNGPALEVDEHDQSVGINYVNFDDNNANKAIGGRVGFLPLDDASMEIGVGAHYADKIGDEDTEYEDVSAFSWSSDLTWQLRNISAFRGNIELRGQINSMDVDHFHVPDDHGKTEVNLDQHAYYGQLAYRPIMAGNPLISDMELVLRYSFHDLPVSPFEDTDDDPDHSYAPNPQDASAGIANYEILNGTDDDHDDHNDVSGDQTQWGFGLNYWLSWKTVFKVSYQIDEFNGQTSDAWFIHFATGL